MLVCPVLVRWCSLGRRGAALGAVARLTPVHRACGGGRDPRRKSDGSPAEYHTKFRCLENAKTRRVVTVGNKTQSSGQSGVVAGRWLSDCSPRGGQSKRGSSVGLPALAQLECGRDRRGPRRRWPATCVAQR